MKTRPVSLNLTICIKWRKHHNNNLFKKKCPQYFRAVKKTEKVPYKCSQFTVYSSIWILLHPLIHFWRLARFEHSCIWSCSVVRLLNWFLCHFNELNTQFKLHYVYIVSSVCLFSFPDIKAKSSNCLCPSTKNHKNHQCATVKDSSTH